MRSIVLSIIFVVFGLTQPVFSSDIVPPPVLGPPVADASAPQQINSLFVRKMVQDAAEETMTQHNGSSPHKLSWASNATPLLCSHCVLGPTLSATTRPDQPNERVARMSFQLAMDLDINNLPGDRRVITPVDITFRCSGWNSGAGEMQILTRTGVPYLDGTTLLEDIVDFFSPWDLSEFVDGKIKSQLSAGGLGVNAQGPCVSLGVYDDQNIPLYDAVLWDAPVQQSVLDILQGSAVANANTGKVTLALKEIRRLQTPIVPDDTVPVSFDIYVNGTWIDLGAAQTATVAVGDSVALSANRITFPSSDLDAVQVIFATSRGGAGWHNFTRSDDFGKGTQGLKTHAHTYLAPPPGQPRPHKPLPTDIREFELVYDIIRFEPAFQVVSP